MIIHHLRNATFVIESRENFILADPMLSPKGALPAYTRLKHRARRNPLVELPDNAGSILEQVNFCLVTHSRKWGIKALTHTDHLDAEGIAFLKGRNIPVACPAGDASFMKKNGIEVGAAPGDWQTLAFAGGKITAVPACHGHGWIRWFMANGAGFFLELPGEPSIYISGDTVFTEDVEQALTELKPDVAVVAAGGAGLDAGGPILMPVEEILKFVRMAPGRVIANHLEALNHCPVTRAGLRSELEKQGLAAKVLIPSDGESLDVN
ncbi:MAG: MBL fold metallo-hydrolase [Desulfobacterales bacterium]|nr:MBL fold metallo-hydrolase [Desulfobacterales bacterium]